MGVDPVKLGVYGKRTRPAEEAGAGQPAKKHRLIEDPEKRKPEKEQDRLHRQVCVGCSLRASKGLGHHGKGKRVPRVGFICEACGDHYCNDCFFEAHDTVLSSRPK